MSFANHLSSNNCTVSTVDPKPKSGPKAGGGPVGFIFNARPNQTWLQSVHFGFSFSRAITAFTPLHIGYSAKQTKHGCFQEESRPIWLQFSDANKQKMASTPIQWQKNREWHVLSQTKKYWTNNKTKQIWTNFSQLSHKELIFRNSWPVRNGIKNLILSLFCNNFYGILNPPKKFFF